MRPYFALVLTVYCFLSACKGQPKTEARTVYNKEFKWTISIPAGFDTVSASEWARLQNRGAAAIEDTYDQKVENNATTIFIFKKDQFNYFESNYQPFNPDKDGSILVNQQEVSKILYKTFETQMQGATLDSSSFSKTISGLNFHCFKVVITIPNKLVLTCQLFSRLFDKKEFSVNIMTVDKAKEDELMKCWLNSRFEK